ncbi:hypothetical protein Dsin_021510 [Dipteronia sinensis]|uniref:Uncharacterized protein n=1 Tax=Dipteronia sinensis TaxID=43782 RepID=A0AAE0A0B3_9ROSI|nr:hypothetical protein Dsin_021510 [Dipteronia sinensis]
MITCPILAEQFFNEPFIVKVSRIGERVGAIVPSKWREEEQCGVMVKSEEIEKAMDLMMIMDEEEGGKNHKRKRAS